MQTEYKANWTRHIQQQIAPQALALKASAPKPRAPRKKESDSWRKAKSVGVYTEYAEFAPASWLRH